MSRNQNSLVKMNNRLTAAIIILLLIIIALIAVFIFNQHSTLPPSSQSSNSTSVNNTKVESQESSQLIVSSESKTSESSTSKSEYPYAVTFPKGNVFHSMRGMSPFSVKTYPFSDLIEIAWENSPGAPAKSEAATFTPKNIETLTITVNEHSAAVKDVHVNTELILSGTPSPDFFMNFDGLNTKVYAYYMNNGNIALAFSPGKGIDQYQLLELIPAD